MRFMTISMRLDEIDNRHPAKLGLVEWFILTHAFLNTYWAGWTCLAVQ
jgi:hypothetical protein